MEYSFPRYLEAKKTVDDRALNLRVWQRLAQKVRPQEHMLEIGAGTGVMLRRLLENNLLVSGSYTGIDASQENIMVAGEKLLKWASLHGWDCVSGEKTNLAGQVEFLLRQGDRHVTAVFETIDLEDFMARERGRQTWSGLIAHAFLDLVNVPPTLAQILPLLEAQGWLYLTLNFDRLTVFEPVFDEALEDRILAAYHRSMDDRGAGESRTGRRLFTWLTQAGLEILAVGASDWLVYPNHGRYPQDEAYFLKHILYFFEQSLTGRGEVSAEELAGWLAQRRTQVERGELVFIAHQVDFLSSKP